MKGLLMLVYTVVTWYLSTSAFIVPLYLLSSIKPLKKTCNDLSRYIMGLSMNNASFFLQKNIKYTITFLW